MADAGELPNRLQLDEAKGFTKSEEVTLRHNLKGEQESCGGL
jgi:hypothetical protein